MQNVIWHIRFICLTGLIINCSGIGAYAQSIPAPIIATPNTASLSKFGDIPVDLSTGVPNISIPVHTLQYGSISVPITLRYHPGSVKVAQHPGWVGMGWDLQSIGSITRQVNWLPDEFYGSPLINGTSLLTYYPEPVTSNPPIPGSDLVDVTDWNTQSRLASYWTTYMVPPDVSADEFSFNFLGYSGKFYYVGGSAKRWQVVCDQNVKVDLIDNVNPCMTGSEVLASVSNYSQLNPGALTAAGASENATRVFKGFILTAPDGTKYYFGGPDATEFSTPYDGAIGVQFTANAWLLTRIVDADNNEIDFQYRRSYPSCTLGFGYSSNSWNCLEKSYGTPLLTLTNNSGSGWATSSGVNPGVHGGSINLSLYLNQITSPNEKITFNAGVVFNSCLRFSNTVLNYRKSDNDPNNKFNLNILGDGLPDGNGNIINGANNLQWEQLNNIVITNSNNQIYRQYRFVYSSDPTKRLMLQSFSELDNAGNSMALYGFNYNTDIPATALYDANYTDHWGFYNGQNIATANTNYSDGTSGSIFTLKQTNPSLVTNSLLNRITYPTGGYSVFTWQAHDYSQVISTARNSPLNSQTGYAGGGRIGKVQSYLPDGTLALDKKYFYVRSYSRANQNGLTSSGILNGNPTYYMSLPGRSGVQGTLMIDLQVASLNSLSVYSYNSQASYIGYDEVVEVNADGSYTKTFFTSYGTDLNGVSHWDVAPVASLGWVQGQDKYYTMSTLEAERGKPIAVFKYSANDVLVQKTIYTYTNDPARFNNYIKLITFNGVFSGCSQTDALLLATANQKFTYTYYLTNEAVTNYDQQGLNPVTTTTSYSYNLYKSVSTKTEVNSKAESFLTTYKYPFDFSDATSQAMVNANIISPVIQTSINKNGNLISQTQTNYFSPNTGMYKPQIILGKLGSNPIETRLQFYQYDTHGNLQELSKVNDTHEVYLWGYNNQYPVAKITGSSLSTVMQYITQVQLDNAASYTDAQMRSALNNIRTGIPTALVTTYTYSPVTGSTSETDPRGKTTYYQYDTFQRLKLITDNNGSILKTFNYQLQIH